MQLQGVHGSGGKRGSTVQSQSHNMMLATLANLTSHFSVNRTKEVKNLLDQTMKEFSAKLLTALCSSLYKFLNFYYNFYYFPTFLIPSFAMGTGSQLCWTVLGKYLVT